MKKRILKRPAATLPMRSNRKRKPPDVSNVELWDCEAPSRGLDPLLWGHRTDTSLRRKVERLEAWAKEGWPDDIDPLSLAKNETRLRKWADPSLKLWSWSDAEPEKRERNKELMIRWSDAIASIRREDWKLVGAEKSADDLKGVIELLETQVKELIAQNSWLESKLANALAGLPVA